MKRCRYKPKEYADAQVLNGPVSGFSATKSKCPEPEVKSWHEPSGLPENSRPVFSEAASVWLLAPLLVRLAAGGFYRQETALFFSRNRLRNFGVVLPQLRLFRRFSATARPHGPRTMTNWSAYRQESRRLQVLIVTVSPHRELGSSTAADRCQPNPENVLKGTSPSHLDRSGI